MTKRRGGASRPLSLPGVEVNARNVVGAVTLMAAIPDRRASLVILDPQYRAVLDKLAYGNEGARQKGRAALPQMRDDDISWIVEEAERVLKPSGHLAFWTDKFSVASGHHLRHFRRTPELQTVEMIVWNKLRIGMGRRARCSFEACLVLQKQPTRAAGVWTDHSIPDCWPEGQDAARHPHAKPHRLTEALIRAVTKRGDLVVDPCAGGYGVLDACLLSGRTFVGGDVV